MSKKQVIAAAEMAEDPVTQDEALAQVRCKEDVVHWCYDNEHESGVLCTLTFSDGSTATGIAERTDNLGLDQNLASAIALASVA